MSSNRPVAIWLAITCVTILVMVMVGGITRLTDSGLSIVEWKPLMGAIPPMSEEQWVEVFEKYKAYPEYKLEKSHYTLSEFKVIFFWEYFHRLIGRLIGVIYFIPFAIFLVKGNLSRSLKWKLAIGFILGGLQGLMGWYMVKSGLIDRPDVSHFRLAVHFGLALFIVGYLFWIFMDLTDFKKNQRVRDPLLTKLTLGFLVLLVIQITYGAFVAGLDAGIGYNTFPKMNGHWIPRQILFIEPAWLNFLENPAALQFTHRMLGWLVAFVSLALFVLSRVRDLASTQKNIFSLVSVMVLIQFLLGVATLVLKVPLSLASAHQMGACILLLLTLRALYIMLHSAKNSNI